MNTIFIGMGGWELAPFNNYFYPPRPKKGFRKLQYFSQFFDCVEINATFYNTAFKPEHAKNWLEDVSANEHFVFTVKLFRGFTHTYDVTKEDILAIHRLLEPLVGADKLGGVLAQFPYSFTQLPERRQYLGRLAALFGRYRLFVEVRHDSWNTPEAFRFFSERGIHAVNVDLPGIKRHMPLTSTASGGAAYFRMMGRNALTWNYPWRLEQDRKHVVSDRYRYLYSEEELEQLLVLIERVRSSAETIFVVFHNDPEANSLINGFQLRHRVRQRQRVLVPQNLINAYPKLRGISSEVNVHHPLFAEI